MTFSVLRFAFAALFGLKRFDENCETKPLCRRERKRPNRSSAPPLSFSGRIFLVPMGFLKRQKMTFSIILAKAGNLSFRSFFHSWNSGFRRREDFLQFHRSPTLNSFFPAKYRSESGFSILALLGITARRGKAGGRSSG